MIGKPWRLLALVLVGCGSGGGNADAGPDATTDDGAPANDGESSDAGSSDEKVPVLDACVPIDGGLPCDPGHVQCGPAQKCTAGAQFCCIENDASSFTCDTTVTQCQPMMMGSQGTLAYCDEAANCPDAQVCCGFVGAGGGYVASCQASCEGNAVQLCRGSAECASGACVGQTCNGVYVETCGALLECP